MVKKILFFIALFHFVGVFNIALSEIIPLKKPQQSKEETQIKLLTDSIKPLQKPITKKKPVEIKKKVVEKKQINSGLILPKKKPLIAGSQKPKNIKISKYYNKKDFSLADKAISEMKKAQWPRPVSWRKRISTMAFA